MRKYQQVLMSCLSSSAPLSIVGYSVANANSITDANGTYTESGTYNSRPAFTNGTCWLFATNWGGGGGGLIWAIAASKTGYIMEPAYVYTTVQDLLVPYIGDYKYYYDFAKLATVTAIYG